MKKIIIAFLLFYTSLNAQTVTLTLEESLKLGLENSKELQIANSMLIKANAVKDEISSSMLPKLSLSAGYSRLNDVPPFAIQLPFSTSMQTFTIQETILDNYNINASLEQPLFTGFKLSSLKSAADYNIKAEKKLFDREKNNKADEIQKTFWKFYNSEKMVELLNESLMALKTHLKDTESFLENGMVTKNDFLKLKVEVANMELKLLDAKNNMQLARSLFNKIIGLSLNNKTELVIEEISFKSFEEDYTNLSEEAKLSREEIQSSELRIKALEEKETAAMSDWYPQLFAFANYYYNKPNLRYLPLENEFNDSWSLGVALKWNIWNWGGTSAKVEQARQDYFQAENFLKLLKENIEMDVYNNFLNLKSKIKKIKLGKLQVESAEENYRITKEKYNQQLATSSDLIDSEASLLNARTMLITSKIEYQLSKVALEKAVGRKIY